MDFYDNYTKPTKNDVLAVNTTLPDKTVLTSKVKYFNAKKNKYYDFINPNFEFWNKTLKYTDKNTHKEFKKIYDKTLKDAKYNFK